jgi:hypothetical protein
MELESVVAACLFLIACLTCSLTMKMGAVRSTEMSLKYRTTRRYKPGESTLRSQRREDFKSNNTLRCSSKCKTQNQTHWKRKFLPIQQQQLRGL